MTLSINASNFGISVAGLMVCILGLLLAVMGSAPEKRIKHYFITIFSFFLAYAAVNLCGLCSLNVPFQMTTLFLESALSSVLMLLLMGFLLESSGERRWLGSRTFRIAAGLWIVYMALLVYTQFSGTIYFFDAQGLYHRGPFYPVLLAPPVLIMLLNLLLLRRRRGSLSRKQCTAFAVYILVPMFSMLIQMLFFGLYVIVLGTSVSALFMLLYIYRDQAELYAKQEAENTQLRVEIMLSQIQPHFLYNTLGSISHLCRSVPEAQAAINRFSRYLQGNMASLSQTEPIPFTTELEHTKTYLELEQLRFGDDLTVRYALEATGFLLPVLTLQPLAENAVFHGVRGNPDGRGTVTISSRECADHYEITVADDGPGFDPDVPPEGEGSHIGLSNVRTRLRRYQGADLLVDSAPGQGCRVTIRMPKEIQYADLRH